MPHRTAPPHGVAHIGGPYTLRQFDLSIGGSDVRFTAALPARPAGLGDLVPLARSLSDLLSLRSIEAARAGGRVVPCRRGCAACCRYLVPVSAPEAMRIGRELDALRGGERRRMLASFAAAGRRLVTGGGPPLSVEGRAPGETSEELDQLSDWYAGLHLSCPLLRDELCTRYLDRPLVCREHAVTGQASGCVPHGPDTAERIAPPVRVSEALVRVGVMLEGGEGEAVLLPLVPIWFRIHAERVRRTWAPEQLLESFAEALGVGVRVA